jgi:hypothetical protein
LVVAINHPQVTHGTSKTKNQPNHPFFHPSTINHPQVTHGTSKTKNQPNRPFFHHALYVVAINQPQVTHGTSKTKNQPNHPPFFTMLRPLQILNNNNCTDSHMIKQPFDPYHKTNKRLLKIMLNI